VRALSDLENFAGMGCSGLLYVEEVDLAPASAQP
jgi:hypothetical protein